MLLSVLSGLCILALIGYVVSHFLNRMNHRIIDHQKISESFINKKNWLSAFGAFFTAFYLLLNLVLWALFGAEQILAFALFILIKIKQLLTWIWETILSPTVVLILKLLWHYPIGFLWKNTQLSVSKISPSFNLKDQKKASLILMKLLAALAGVYVIQSLVDQTWFDVIALLATLGGLIYLMVSLGLIYANHPSMLVARRAILIKFGALLLLAASIGVVALIFVLNNHHISFSSIGLPATEILLPIATLLSLAIALTVPFGIAYFMEKGETDWNSYISNLVSRLPKLIYALPFLAFGLFIVSLLPALVYFGLDLGTGLISGANINEHHTRIIQFSDLDNQYIELSSDIEAAQLEIKRIDSISAADSIATYALIAEIESDIADIQSIADQLMAQQIFHLPEDFYETEGQTFSFPPILNCQSYSWEIKDSDDNLIFSKSIPAEKEHSSVLYFKWSEEGRYSISVIPENSCEKGEKYTAAIKVLDYPKRSDAARISGPTSLCAYDEVTFTTSDNFSQYEWVVPEGVSILEGSGTDKIKVKWGANSGVISLRGNKKGEASSVYTNVEVAVNPGLDEINVENFQYPEDDPDFEFPSHSFTFYDVAEANDSIKTLHLMIEAAVYDRETRADQWLTKVNSIENQIEQFEETQDSLIVTWLSTLFSMMGFILLSVLLLPGLGYFFKFHHALFSFHQEGTHYIINQWNELKDRDDRQPLLGWFLLVVLSLSASLFFGAASMGSLPFELPFDFDQQVKFSINHGDTGSIEELAPINQDTYKIQLFAGSRQKSEAYISALSNQGLSCEMIEKLDGSFRVVLADSFLNADTACSELILFKESSPSYSESFLIVGHNGEFEAYDTMNCF